MRVVHACRRVFIPGVAALVAVAPAVHAQTKFETIIQSYTAGTIQGYVQPLADLTVANLNIGFFHSAAIPRNRLGVSFDAVALGSPVKDAQKTYTAQTPPGFNPQTFQTATIFGGTGTTVNHATIAGVSYRGSDGFIDATYFPAAVPQLTVGGIFGTEVTARYFTSSFLGIDEQDFPELKFRGFGARHSISQYFPLLPVDIAVSFSTSSLTWGDMVDLDATAFGAQVGKTFSVLSLYGGIQNESGTMALSYTSTSPLQTVPVNVDIDVKSTVRFTAGAIIKFGFLNLFGDAGFGDVTTFAGGFRFGF
jgi:hypothetical protein